MQVLRCASLAATLITNSLYAQRPVATEPGECSQANQCFTDRIAGFGEAWVSLGSIPIPTGSLGVMKQTVAQSLEQPHAPGFKGTVDARPNNASQFDGSGKRDDLRSLFEEILRMTYVEAPLLAPTQELHDASRKSKGRWEDYERDFLRLMEERHIDDKIGPALLAGGDLLCSEGKPHKCHRRLVEYLQRQWGNLYTKRIV
jgi:hypothetical protein